MGMAGEVMMDVVEERGSNEATLDRMDGIETRDRVRKGHRGDAPEFEVVASVVDELDCARLARGVLVSSSGDSTGAGGVAAGLVAVKGLDKGDRFSEPRLSRGRPRTALRREPFRLRTFEFVVSVKVSRSMGVGSSPASSFSSGALSLERRTFNRENRLLDMLFLCFGEVLLSIGRGVSSSIEGNGTEASVGFDR